MTDNPDLTNTPESSVDPNSIEGIFISALNREAGDEREAFLQQTCTDPAQQARVRVLLMAYDDSGAFLQQPAAQLNPLDSFSQYMTPSDKPDVIGQLGDYEILETIGRGGMGVVFRALDTKLNRIVAIKALAPELSSNPNSRRRFLREAQAVASVMHPHIVGIHAVNDDKLPYFVMECIVGQSLQQKLDKCGAFGLKEVLRIGQQLAEGIGAAHRQGIVHRDIKPANILLENGVERVRITDFGLARARDDESITMTGEVSGTPMYMSPEQAKGETIDHRSDLFSLGAVLFAMCTGHSPFRGSNMAAVVKNVCDTNPRPVSEFNSEFPEWLDQLICQLLDKNPEGRPSDAESVAEALRLGLAGEAPTISTVRPVAQASGVATAASAASAAGISPASTSDISDNEMTLEAAVKRQATQMKCLAIVSVIVSLGMLALGRGESVLKINTVSIWALLGSVVFVNFLLWFAMHLTGFHKGGKSWWSGFVASFISLLALPSFILSFPIGIATLALLQRSGVKDAFRLAGEGDMSAMQQIVPRPRASWLVKFLGAAMTFVTCLRIYAPDDKASLTTIGTAVYMTLLIGLLALVVFQLLSQFSLRDQARSLLRRPALAFGLLAAMTAVLAYPFIPKTNSAATVRSSGALSYNSIPGNSPIAQPLIDTLNEAEMTAVLSIAPHGGLILNIEKGLVVELHKDGLVWRFSPGRMIGPRGARAAYEFRESMMTYADYPAANDEDVDFTVGGGMGYGSPMDEEFGMGGGDADYGGDAYGSSSGFGSMPVATVRPATNSVHELPVGEYEIFVFDKLVGWGRDVALHKRRFEVRGVGKIGTIINNIVGTESGGNELPKPYRSAYAAGTVKVTVGKIENHHVERDFAKLGSIQPNWESPELFRFQWGQKQWTLDKAQAQCVQLLLNSRAVSTSRFLGEASMLAEVETEAETLQEVFNDGQHPAFDAGLFVKQVRDGVISYSLKELPPLKTDPSEADVQTTVEPLNSTIDTEEDDDDAEEATAKEEP